MINYRWDKIIPGIIVLILVISYLIDSIRKNFGNKKKGGRKNVGIKGLCLDILEIAAPLLAVFVVFTCIIQITTCQSPSMEPGIMTGNTVFYNRLAYKTGNPPQRGDVVSFYSDEFEAYFSKRIIGVAGDTVAFSDGKVMVNGKYLDESGYLDENVITVSEKTFVVPAGCCFMLGDNRGGSNDSRYWSNPYIPIDKIVGKYIGQIGFSVEKNIMGLLWKKDT